MNNPSPLGLLEDLKEQCRLLIEDTNGVSWQQFQDDRILQRAVERYLTIIGEIGSLIRLRHPKIFESLPDLQSAAGLRNRLAHGYGDDINDEVIWETVTVWIPHLLEDIDRQRQD